jgi:uncharacterized protein
MSGGRLLSRHRGRLGEGTCENFFFTVCMTLTTCEALWIHWPLLLQIVGAKRGLIWPSNPRCFCGTKEGMNRQEILDRLRENERALRERGVTHAALFGSRARGDNRPTSDTDIMIDIDPEADMSVYDYVGLKRYIASLFDGPVDVIDREALKPYARSPAEGDAVYAF